jgi:Putative zinc-finger
VQTKDDVMAKPFHLSDQEILLVLDGELSRRRAKRVQNHLASCPACSSRQRELESTIADFVSLRQDDVSSHLPSPDGSRALLKARLSEAAAQRSAADAILQIFAPHRAAVYLGMGILLTVLGGKFVMQHAQLHQVANAAVPNPTLTPGATHPVALNDVCSMAHEEVVRDVPDVLRQQVFKEYGIVNPRPEDYEIDYLIAPGLGGTEDIHNLWPEPSKLSVWNAHVKDDLEERLHQLVCAGKLDLPTAQQAIATNWISAYKRYLGNATTPAQIAKI